MTEPKKRPISPDRWQRLMLKIGNCPECRRKAEAIYRVASTGKESGGD